MIHMCLRAIKTKHYSCSAYLSSVSWAITSTYTLSRLSSFQNLRRKGGKFDHRPERPSLATTLHWRADPIIGSALNCLWHLKISVTTPRFKKRHWFVGAYFDVHQPIFMTLAEMLLREMTVMRTVISHLFSHWGTCVWTTFPRSLPESARPGVEPATFGVASPTP